MRVLFSSYQEVTNSKLRYLLNHMFSNLLLVNIHTLGNRLNLINSTAIVFNVDGSFRIFLSDVTARLGLDTAA